MAQAAPSVALSHRLAVRMQNSRFASVPGGRTLGTLIHLEAEPLWARLIYVNDQPVPWTIDGAAIATTAGTSDGLQPMSADGDVNPSPWRPVTFDADGQDSEPPMAGTAGRRSMTVPGNPRETGRPVHVLSDWIPLRAVARRDDGSGFLLLVRTFSEGGMRFAASVGGPDAAIGRAHAAGWAEGDATGSDTVSFARDDTLFACHGVEIITPTPGATVVGIGDSIIHSSCTTGELSGFGIRACAMLSRPGRPVSYVNEGFPGRNSTGFCANGLWDLAVLRPQVALIQTWSQNEPWTAEMAGLAFARALAVADTARRQGCVPILTTAAPVFQDHAGSEPVRRAAVERVRQLGRAGMPVLDLDALWGTGSEPNSYRVDYDAGDRTHPNDRACVAAALVLAPMLERILGSPHA